MLVTDLVVSVPDEAPEIVAEDLFSRIFIDVRWRFMEIYGGFCPFLK